MVVRVIEGGLEEWHNIYADALAVRYLCVCVCVYAYLCVLVGGRETATSTHSSTFTHPLSLSRTYTPTHIHTHRLEDICPIREEEKAEGEEAGPKIQEEDEF
jgi:hypothetical protein